MPDPATSSLPIATPPTSIGAASVPARSAWRRSFLVGAGWIVMALAALGVFLPILPTTPFVLLAAACFSKSSPRFHAWLVGHRRFGALIRDWQVHRALPRRTKRWAICAFVVTMGIALAAVPLAAVRIGLAVVAIGLLTMLLRIPVR